MCLSPLNILNRSKYVDVHHGSAMRYIVPCGKCIECQQDRINSFQARAWADCKYTQDHGGLSYVDCLTYDDDNLPLLVGNKIVRNNGKSSVNHIYAGIPVFYKRDVRLFFVRLRENLKKAGFYISVPYQHIEKDGQSVTKYRKVVPLRHFCTFEFGGQFHRPHMHVMFNLLMSCDPFVFEKIVQDSWTLGIIDKYKKDGSLKLASDKVIKSSHAVAYISKYVVKDDDYILFLAEELCKARGENHDFSLHTDNPRLLSERWSYVREVLGDDLFSCVKPSVFISNGFGESLVQKHLVIDGELTVSDQYKYAFETGLCECKDGNGKVANTFKLPQYIKRKLWYKDVKDFDGSHHWELNEDGVDFRLGRVNQTIEFMEKRYQELYDTMGNYVLKDTDCRNLRNRILYLLGNRSFYDLAVYSCFYRGRLFDDFQLVDIYELSVKDKQIFSRSECYENFRIPLSFSDFSREVICKFNDHSSVKFRSSPCTFSELYSSFLRFLEKKFLVTEKTHVLFNDFDTIISIFEHVQHRKQLCVSAELREKKRVKDMAKLVDPRYRQHEVNNLNHRKLIKQQIYDNSFAKT